jgi:hypothetical protein
MDVAPSCSETPRQARLSAAALVLANLAPLAGVLFFEWSVSSVLILYWFENIVIGVINVAKMLVASPANDALVAALAAADEPRPAVFGSVGGAPTVQGLKLFVIPFFVFHYFFFCAGHGVFLFAMFGDGDGYFGATDSFGLLGSLGRAVEIFATPLAFAAVVLVLSHVFSFIQNYIAGGEYKQLDLRRLMTMPYGRITALHLTIIAGGFTTMALGQPLWALVILVAVKAAVDLKMHVAEHRKAHVLVS